jgi:hypothetical protein
MSSEFFAAVAPGGFARCASEGLDYFRIGNTVLRNDS